MKNEIADLQDQIQDLRNQAVHSDKQLSDAKLTNQITKLVGDKLNYKNISNNYKQLAKAVSPDIASAKRLASYIKDNFIDNITNEPVSTNNQRFKRVIGRFIGAELEGNALGQDKGIFEGDTEFSFERYTNRHTGSNCLQQSQLHRKRDIYSQRECKSK